MISTSDILNNKKTNPIILGIDPGTIKMGFAIVRFNKPMPELLEYGTLNLKHIESAHEKLHQIFVKIEQLTQKFEVHEFAIEAPFYGKNIQSLLKLGRAQGVAISAAMYFGLITAEYSPRKIKQSVAGNGNASKEQVARMIEKQFGINLGEASLDATDALSVALCHAFCRDTISFNSKSKGWTSYIKENPGKVKS